MPPPQDDTRFIEALTRHQPALEAFCHANLANREDAREVSQLPTFKGPTAGVKREIDMPLIDLSANKDRQWSLDQPTHPGLAVMGKVTAKPGVQKQSLALNGDSLLQVKDSAATTHHEKGFTCAIWVNPYAMKNGQQMIALSHQERFPVQPSFADLLTGQAPVPQLMQELMRFVEARPENPA